MHAIASKIVKEIVLPELEREVNEDANFAPLRQVYSGMLLATWFKRTLKQSLLGQIYANKAKVRGVDYASGGVIARTEATKQSFPMKRFTIGIYKPTKKACLILSKKM